ncbi:general transcription factor II-I repeat domain-containing protein 2 [Nephila pilipes]|uniref:General transcription factor II-I repeat domain-containing protein 2 n=1 Tax=Nephila pilipes TaxID=299642 RepID=A0A8X6MZK6_NEPPI|nr:general transcription factor II-I repeat domain-containing protein 2 [Nephila pilipes]
MFIRQNTAQKASTLAGYVVAYKIAKNNKPYSEGKFIKDCMMSMGKILCPEKIKEFKSVSLSRKTVTTQINVIATNLSTQFRQRIENFKYFSVTMDESTDRSDTAQLLIFIRGVDDEFDITEELACLQSIKGKTTGQIIYNEFSEGLQNLNAPISRLCNITTDGVPNMVGKNAGFSDETWGCLKSFKTQLSLFYNCMAKNDLTHFPRLKSMSPVSENKLKEFSQALKKPHTEFETRFQDFKNIQSSLDVFSIPFNVDPENVCAELQLEIIEMQYSTHLKQLFLNSTKLDFYRALPKAEFPKIIAHAQKIMAMFASSYVCEQTFSTMKLRKNSIRNRLTDEHLFALLKVASSQLVPAFENIMENQKNSICLTRLTRQSLRIKVKLII